MGKIAEQLKKIIETSDLSSLPDLIGQVAQHETEFDQLSTDLGNSKELAHKYLKMIPIIDQSEPEKKKPEEPKTPSFKEIVDNILKEREI